jgi:hypothetical protein
MRRGGNDVEEERDGLLVEKGKGNEEKKNIEVDKKKQKNLHCMDVDEYGIRDKQVTEVTVTELEQFRVFRYFDTKHCTTEKCCSYLLIANV